MQTKDVQVNPKLIAACGLYCAACGKYIAGKCPGCAENVKATWCKIRTCCSESNIQSCAGCKTMTTTQECKKMNNFISKIFAMLFKSDRNACIARIKEVGYDKYAQEMSEQKLQSIKRK
jgi:hypothetical protein